MKRRPSNTEKMFEDFFGFDTKPKKPDPTPADVVPEPPVALPTRPAPPVVSNPAVHMACGHWQLQSIPRQLQPGEDAYTSKGPTTLCVVVATPEECHYCRMNVPGNPVYQEEAYRKPVPRGRRRTAERQAGPGWPGYCCDADGYYIGGISNDCRSNPGGLRCEVHRGGR